MNRLGVLLVACAAIGSGCSASDNTIYITHNQVILTNCDVPDGSGKDFRGTGTLDVTDPQPGTNFTNPGYFFAAAVVNSSAPSTLEATAHLFYLKGADVELRSNGSDESDALIAALSARSLNARTQLFSGSIPPSSTAGVGFFVIDMDQAAAMNDFLSATPVQVVTRSRIFGTMDSSDLEAPPFDYPVTVCKGCLTNFLGPCSSIVSGSTIQTGGICNSSQDGRIDCCSDANGATVCPAPTTTPSG